MIVRLTTRRSLAIVALGLLVAIAGCGKSASEVNRPPSSSPTPTSSSTAPTPTDGPTDTSMSTPTNSPTSTPTHPASAPVRLGGTVKIPDWTVRLTAVQANATHAIIKASGGFVTTPVHQYALFSYEATYTGPHTTGDVLNDLTWQLTPQHGPVVPAAGTSPPAVYAQWPTTARPGGTVRFQVVFDVSSRQLAGAVISVGRIGSSFASVHGDFQL